MIIRLDEPASWRQAYEPVILLRKPDSTYHASSVIPIPPHLESNIGGGGGGGGGGGDRNTEELRRRR